jgi:ABC-type branched-subunit amino acid transport system substrate-binding protein
LLPQSIENPIYPQSFLNGLKLGINQHKAISKGKVELITEQINFGTPMQVKEKSQKLISENNVDLITGVVNSEVAAYVGEMYKNSQVPGVLASAGETYITAELKQHPYLFFNGLGLLQAAYETGKYAVSNYGKKVAIITSFYDSGYDSLFSFRKGVENEGGEEPQTYVLNGGTSDFYARTFEALHESKPDCVYVFMHGKDSDETIRNLKLQKLDVPILSTAFSTEKHRLNNLGNAADIIVSLSPWCKSLATPENKDFIEAYEKEYRKEPDLFGVLGFETGLVLYDALTRAKGDFKGASIAANLAQTQLKSPRGNITINPSSGCVSSEMLLTKTSGNGAFIPEHQILSSFSPINEFEKSLEVLDNDFRSGWLNPYLFV